MTRRSDDEQFERAVTMALFVAVVACLGAFVLAYHFAGAYQP